MSRKKQNNYSNQKQSSTKEVKEVKLRRVRIDDLNTFEPLTENQKRAYSEYDTDTNIVLDGSAGTGKTFLSLYLALEEVLDPSYSYKKVAIFRSAVATRNIGFLKGDDNEKIAVYEAPYQGICEELFGMKDAYESLKEQGNIEFRSTSFNRGISLDNTIFYVDEMQNLSFHELDTIQTRIGKNSKIIYSGDYTQTDLEKRDSGGILEFLKIIKEMGRFSYTTFTTDDIVRSELVKEYLVTKAKLGM